MDAINPREIIAMAVRNAGRANSYNKALFVISDLKANGYQIIHRDENHGPTLERAAESVERRNYPSVGDARRIAAAIRAMGEKK